MTKLGTTLKPSDGTMKAIEKFVCELCVSNTSLKTEKGLRWWLFSRKKQGQSETLPPTQGGLRELSCFTCSLATKPWCGTTMLSQTLTYHLLKTMAGRKRTTDGFQ